MDFLERAIKDGYAYISGTESKQKITYFASNNHSENYNNPEEKVRAEFWSVGRYIDGNPVVLRRDFVVALAQKTTA